LKTKVDINCDLGESYGAFHMGNDRAIMPHITSANVACGFHAGDPTTIARTLQLAKRFNVAVGAHPAYPDLMGFGRREMSLTIEELRNYVIYQVSALEGFAKASGIQLQHVKLHGALYNKAAKNSETAQTAVKAIKALNPNLIVFAPPKSALAEAAAKAGIRVAYEVFADRAYNPDGTLVSRRRPNALITDVKTIIKRIIQMVKEQTVTAVNGENIQLGEVDTVCVHGDTPEAVNIAKNLKRALIKAGVQVKPVRAFL
jgi:UPF0271 protein